MSLGFCVVDSSSSSSSTVSNRRDSCDSSSAFIVESVVLFKVDGHMRKEILRWNTGFGAKIRSWDHCYLFL